MNFLDQFWQIVCQYPDSTAIVDRGGSRHTTYQELYVLSRKTAAKLGKEGDMTGKTVLVCMERRMEYVAAEIGIMMAGAAYVPLLPEYPQEQWDNIRKDCGAICAVDAAWMEAARQTDSVDDHFIGRNGTADRDRALIIYTSGSTGQPKGIVHSHASLYGGVTRSVQALGLDETECMAASSPMSCITTVPEYFAVLSSGGCVHILSDEVREDVHLLEAYYAENDITCGFISPQQLPDFKNRGSALKKVFTGGQRLSMICGDGYVLYNCYGLSESASLVTSYKVEESVENTPIGRPASGVSITLLDENGREVSDGKEGEICIRGILGESYLNLEEQSKYTFRRLEDGAVLLHTGDIGRRLPDGNYVYVNRKN